ncbi:MAG: transposase [Gammaproteobacteria bacterium]
MPRLPRLAAPGQPHHIIQRGNNRQAIFADTQDYAVYLEWLREAAKRFRLYIHSYVLMTNHVHLLATPSTAESMGHTLQSLGRRYVQYFNYTYGRTGTLWEGRYRATAIAAEDYLLLCSRYIELNPVRAGMVNSAAHYRWSSYRHNAQGRNDAMLSPHPVYQRLGTDQQARCGAYRELFRYVMDENEVEELREATNKSWALGNDRFKAQVEALSKRRVSPLARGRPKQTTGGK